MISNDKNEAPTSIDIDAFIKSIDFNLPKGYLEFMNDSNGADIIGEENFVLLWPLTDLLDLNKAYHAEEFAPGFFLFGSDGSDIAYAIEKTSSRIFELPFIGLSNHEAIFVSNDFEEFLKNLK